MTFNIDKVASSTLRLLRYANCNGSSRCSTWGNIYFSNILSNDFISRDVRAIGLHHVKIWQSLPGGKYFILFLENP